MSRLPRTRHREERVGAKKSVPGEAPAIGGGAA